jgi:hypothetical protein
LGACRVSGCGVPPFSETRINPGVAVVANTMVPPEPQVTPTNPPADPGASQIVTGLPPPTRIFLSFDSVGSLKPIHSPSGETNVAPMRPSAPRTGTASIWSSARV